MTTKPGTPARKKRRRLSAYHIARMRLLYQEGYGVADLAGRFDCHVNTVSGIVNNKTHTRVTLKAAEMNPPPNSAEDAQRTRDKLELAGKMLEGRYRRR